MQIDRSGQLKSYAAEAASAFVSRDESLNEKIASIVRQHSLTGDQAATVCKFANHLVHRSLRSGGDTMVEFDLAEPEQVASLTRGARPVMPMVYKLGAAGEDCTASLEKIAGFDHETSVARRTRLQEERGQLERAKLAADHALDAVDYADACVREGLTKLGQRLHDHAAIEGGDLDSVMSELAQFQGLASRPELLVKVAQCVKAVGVVMSRPITFSDATMVHLTRGGMEKNAADIDPSMVTPGLSMAGMPVAIIRGSHRVWVELDTLIDQYDDLSGNKDKLAPMQDRVRYLRRVVYQDNGGAESTLAARAV